MDAEHSLDRTLTAPASTDIRVKGRPVRVNSTEIDGRTIIATGRWLTIASVKDEELVEGGAVNDPESFMAALRQSGLRADIFTFAQRLPDVVPHHPYRLEWDNPAVIPLTTFSDWWDKRVESSVRRAVRKANKVGLVTKPADMDDDFVRGIADIYNETPIRQGKAFWHYQKDLESVRAENSTYPDRSSVIGAYYEGELVGFLKMIYVDTMASITQILSKMKHFDKRPSNALLASAVELCLQRGLTHLMYCSYVYNDADSSLTEFKRRNGFEQVLVPRYYVPLTAKGRLALRFNLQHGVKGSIPKPLLVRLLRLRSRWNARRARTTPESA